MKNTEKTGILYGIGVGPGDPELVTLKAVRIVGECDTVILPGKKQRGLHRLRNHERGMWENCRKRIDMYALSDDKG